MSACQDQAHSEVSVAVGNIAHAALARSGWSVPRVRHPAHGGREEFRRGLEALLAEGAIA